MAQLVNFYLCNQPEKNGISPRWRWKSAGMLNSKKQAKVKISPLWWLCFQKSARWGWGWGLGCPTHTGLPALSLSLESCSALCCYQATHVAGTSWCLLSILSYPEILSMHPPCFSQQVSSLTNDYGRTYHLFTILPSHSCLPSGLPHSLTLDWATWTQWHAQF